MKWQNCASTLVVGLCVAAQAQAPAQELTLHERVARVDEYASRVHGYGGFDGAIFIAKGDQVLLAKGWGEADKDSHRPWTPDTVSTVGSITKQFTGAAVTLLTQEGKLEFTDTVGDYFPDAPTDKAGITIHQLLTHSAGLPDGIGPDEEKVGREAYLARVWDRELLFAPGERYQYSNVGYSVAAAIVEKVTGQGYEAFVRERLFLPAGMHDTGYTIPDWDDERFATGYRNGERWGTVQEKQGGDFSWHLVGNGGIHSTARDMHRWWLAIRDNTILDEAHTEIYLAPHQDEGGGESFYGYGWVNFETQSGDRMLSHNGGNGFFFADCAFFPELDLFAFVMVNDASARALRTHDIFESLSGAPLALPPDPATVDIAAIEELARERALAFIEAYNSGADAYVQYGFDHRIDRGADEALNESRRTSCEQLSARFGSWTVLTEAPRMPGQHVVNVGTKKSRQVVVVTVTLSDEPPHLVSSVTLGIDGPPPPDGD